MNKVAAAGYSASVQGYNDRTSTVITKFADDCMQTHRAIKFEFMGVATEATVQDAISECDFRLNAGLKQIGVRSSWLEPPP